jgi:hypothetical protein
MYLNGTREVFPRSVFGVAWVDMQRVFLRVLTVSLCLQTMCLRFDTMIYTLLRNQGKKSVSVRLLSVNYREGYIIIDTVIDLVVDYIYIVLTA